MNFERFTSGPIYRILKIISDVIILNILFLLTTILSLGLLTFHGLFSLGKCLKMTSDDKSPVVYREYFKLFKTNLVKGFIYLIIYAAIVYISYLLIQGCILIYNHPEIGYLGWIGLVFIIAVDLVMLIILLHSIVFNAYFSDQKVIDIFRKSALIARKKILVTFLMMVNFVLFVAIAYFLSVFIIIGVISLFIYINIKICNKTYSRLVIEENQRLKEIEDEIDQEVSISESEKESEDE